jgi:hypothetical protein
MQQMDVMGLRLDDGAKASVISTVSRGRRVTHQPVLDISVTPHTAPPPRLLTHLRIKYNVYAHG